MAFVQTVQKRAVTTVKFVRRPCDKCDAVGLRTINRIQCDLWLGPENDVVRNVRFYRRAESLPHSMGWYRRLTPRLTWRCPGNLADAHVWRRFSRVDEIAEDRQWETTEFGRLIRRSEFGATERSLAIT